MKNIIYYFCLLIVFLISCNKEHKTPPPTPSAGKTYKVQFNLSGFTEKISSVGNKKQLDNLRTSSLSSDTSGTDTLTVLDYQVYNSSGVAVHSLVTQEAADGNFSPIADNLVAGTYTVVLVAGKTGLTYNTTANSPMTSDNFFYYYFKGGWQDTFYKKFSLTVSANDTTVNTTLSRVISQLEVNIEDAIPANANNITLSVTNYVTQFNIGLGPQTQVGAFTPPLFPIQVPSTAIGTTNFKFYSIMVANSDAPMNIEIIAKDISGNLVGDAVVNNVICQPNKRTILTGKLFNTSSGNSFQFQLNNEWNPTPYLTITY